MRPLRVLLRRRQRQSGAQVEVFFLLRLRLQQQRGLRQCRADASSLSDVETAAVSSGPQRQRGDGAC
jgi:hypothetical protein